MNNKIKNIGNIRKQITPQQKQVDSKRISKPPVNKEKRTYEVKVWNYDYDLIE